MGPRRIREAEFLTQSYGLRDSQGALWPGAVAFVHHINQLQKMRLVHAVHEHNRKLVSGELLSSRLTYRDPSALLRIRKFMVPA